MKLKYKLIFFYIIVVMIPVLIATNNVEKIKSQLSSKLRVPTDISNLLYFDEDLQKLVNTNYPSILELTKAYLNYSDFKEYILQYREISNIRFYIDNPTLVDDMSIAPLTPEIESRAWYKKAMESKGIYWMYISDKEKYNNSTKGTINKLSLVRQVYYPEYGKAGLLMVQVVQDELNQMLYQEPFDTIIIDEQGYIVSAKNPRLVGSTVDAFDIGMDVQSKSKGAFTTKVKNKDSYVIIDEMSPALSSSKLKIISVFETKSILSSANKVSTLGLLIIGGVLLVALVLVYTISLLTTNRLLRLSRQLNQVALGNLNVVSHIDGTDEIGQLSRQFNYMVASINRLITQVIESNEKNSTLEIAQREIKLKMMASQINPHFLYNTLNSIKWMATIQNATGIAEMTTSLSRLLRSIAKDNRRLMPLKDELSLLDDYFLIQKYRYGSTVSMVKEIENEELLTGLIPRFTLQPLVENAIFHGIEPKGRGDILITVSKSGFADILVTIEDNGVG
ncbi:hypothetical protein KC345_g10621, partial [Hortaea werneckii]